MNGPIPGLNREFRARRARSGENENRSKMDSSSATVASGTNDKVQFSRAPECQNGAPFLPTPGIASGPTGTAFAAGFGHGIERRFANRRQRSGWGYNGWNNNIDYNEDEIHYGGHGLSFGLMLTRGFGGEPGRPSADDDAEDVLEIFEAYPQGFRSGRGPPVLRKRPTAESESELDELENADDSYEELVEEFDTKMPALSLHSPDAPETAAELTTEMVNDGIEKFVGD